MALKIDVTRITSQRLRMSYEEYLALPDDPKIKEWVEGEVIIYMPPVYEHQQLVQFLSGLLNAFIQFFALGKLIIAPFEVKLWADGPSREPDLIFIHNKNLAKLTSKRFDGGPDLLIEVISPSSVSEDRVHKFTEYESAAVGEYWIIDPRPHQQQADFYVLGNDNRYHPGLVDANGIYHSTILPDFWLNVAWLWPDDLPDPQLALAQIMLSIETLPPEVKSAYQTIYQLLTDRP